ncbi:S41 family peptidase, partial [Planctomycetota bacterium]
VARYVGRADLKEAKSILKEILELIEGKYYESPDPVQLFGDSFLHLEAATENSFFKSQFSIRKAGLTELKKGIKIHRDQLELWGNKTDILKAAESLSKLSKKAGLGAAWPAIELSYAIAESLDKYSYLLSPHQYKLLIDQFKGHYVGIGVELMFEGEYPTIFDVLSQGPADKGGVRPGDRLIRVGKRELKNKSAMGVSELLRGSQNSLLEITVQRGEKELEFSLRRDLVSSPSVRYAHLLDKENRIGYLRIANFDNDTATELRGAIEKLKTSGAEGLLIDLRCNGGGIMQAAIDSVRLFIDQGPIVTVQNGGEKTLYKAGGSMPSVKLPLGVLVDKKTASGAEIFTAALKYHHRAIVIGQKTMGKATVQTLYGLQSGPSGLCLTTAIYIPPSNQSINHEGIEPDISVENPYFKQKISLSMADYLGEKDLALQKGLDLLQHHKLY